MNPVTRRALFDELLKIAGVPRALLQGKGAASTKAGKVYASTRPNAAMFGKRWGQYGTPEQREMAREFGESAKNASRKALGLPEKQYGWMKKQGAPKDVANKIFGLPKKPVRRPRSYEPGPSEAMSADRSQFPVAGQSTPNISASNAVSPAYGPGGI